MCAIAGYIGSRKDFPNKSNINDCLKLMQFRRGPDSADQRIMNKEDYSFVFLHSRLSIIDPNPRSKQPMEDDEGILSFSGEIYNYLELKSICKNKGAKFKTKSDTEVLLKILNIFGTKSFEMIDGDWAFSYYNKKEDYILVSRDRFSVKPLFYYIENNNYFFASNINHLFKLMGKKGVVHFKKIKLFLTYGFKSMQSEPETFFENTYNFPGSSYLQIKNGYNRKYNDYWDKRIQVNNSLSYEDSKELVEEEFKKSIKFRLRSDFPIACLLSGGIDSSSIAGIAKKEFNADLHYFSYRAKNKNYNEEEFIKKNIESVGGKHEFIDLDFEDNISELRSLMLDGGVPLNSLSSFSFHRICREVKNLNYRVLLSGVGGDELFAGNYIDHLNYLVSVYKKPIFNEAYEAWKKNIKPFVRSKRLKNFEEHLSNFNKGKNVTWHEAEVIKSYLNISHLQLIKEYQDDYTNDYFRNELNKCLFHENVPPHLFSMDQISMYHSIESRFPFFSKKLYEVVNTIPSNYLMQGALTKSILRDAVNSYVPSKILKSKNKIAFYCDFYETFKVGTEKFKDLLFQNSKLNALLKIDKINKIIKNKDLDVIELKFIFNILNLSLLLEAYD